MIRQGPVTAAERAYGIPLAFTSGKHARWWRLARWSSASHGGRWLRMELLALGEEADEKLGGLAAADVREMYR